MQLRPWDWRAVPVAVLLSVLPSPEVADSPPPMSVVVGDATMLVPPQATLATALRVLRLEPEAGDLVDVEGVPLKKDVYPGSVTVDGRPADLAERLEPSAVLEAIDGENRIEPVTVDVFPVLEGGTPNPQTHVGSVPGEQVITTGQLSGKLVSSAFRPTGGGTAPPAVALTFDDGPSPSFTPRVLRILQQRAVPATFFMVGYLVERYPEVARQVIEAGMAVGNHSMNHHRTPPFADLPEHEIREQVERGHRVLAELGVDSTLFRPPGGSWSPQVMDIASAQGERIVLWSVDSEDFDARQPRVLAANVVREAGPGSIVLLHDGGGNRQATVRALPRIINGLRAKGLALVALS